MKTDDFRHLAQSQMFVSVTSHMNAQEKAQFINWLQLRGLTPSLGSIVHYLSLFEVRKIAKKVLVENRASIEVLKQRAKDDDRWQQRTFVVVCSIAVMMAVQTYLMLR